jgi:hypothetical protein
LTLSWANNATVAVRNTIIRASNSSFTAGLVSNTVAGNVSTFIDPSYKANGVPYYYAVYTTSVVGSGVAGYPSITVNSVPSNVVGPPAGIVTLTSVTQAAPLKSPVVLNWSIAGNGQTGFTIQRATNSGFTTGLANVKVGNVFTYSDTTTKAGVTYWYRVIPFNALGSGTSSNARSITPHA